MAYAALCYVAFLASFAYLVLFLNGVGVPKAVNDGVLRPWPLAVAIDVGLVLLWGLQHSVMARRSFKSWWTRWVPAHTERATYCLASAVALGISMAGWSPLPAVLWDPTSSGVRLALYAVQGLGLVTLLGATFEIDHFELFGLRQPWHALRGEPLPEHAFQARFIYRFVRHPIQTGVFFAMWSHPTMTVGHALFAGLMTAYILVGLYFEERDLVAHFGAQYAEYRKRVPKLIPFIK
jgi:protein-S-isoprenylcysteine O-methyltransferase Ste14